MSVVLRLFIGLASAMLLFVVLRDIVHRKLTEMQSLFWILTSLVMIVVALFPWSVVVLSQFFGVAYAPSMVFALAVVLALFGIYNCYRTNAQLLRKVNELSIQISLLKHEEEKMEAAGEETEAEA